MLWARVRRYLLFVREMWDLPVHLGRLDFWSEGRGRLDKGAVVLLS